MKIILIIAVSLVVFTRVKAQNSFTLKNSNTQTRGITKMNITQQGNGKVKIKIWASCSPKDCYWGRFGTNKNVSYKDMMQRTKKNWIYRYTPFTIKKNHVTR